MTAVRFTPATVRALDRALVVMEADRAAREKWRIVDPELEEAIEELTNHRDRMLAEQAEIAGVINWREAQERRMKRGVA